MINKKAALLFIALFTIIQSYSQQFNIEGRVVDKNTGAPLPFVNMIVTGHPQLGTTADIDGSFKISAPFQITSLSFSYVGYQDTLILINNLSNDIRGVVI